MLTQHAVEAVLGLDDGPSFDHDLLATEIPIVPPKQQLRPCCAFGSDLGVSSPASRSPATAS